MKKKVFSLEQVLDLLFSMQQGLTPNITKHPENPSVPSDLDSVDFLDLPLCKAGELGITAEFYKYMEGHPAIFNPSDWVQPPKRTTEVWMSYKDDTIKKERSFFLMDGFSYNQFKAGFVVSVTSLRTSPENTLANMESYLNGKKKVPGAFYSETFWQWMKVCNEHQGWKIQIIDTRGL